MKIHAPPSGGKPRSNPLWHPDRGLSYSAWYSRERDAGRATKPGAGPHNRGITPVVSPSGRMYDHRPVRRGLVQRILGAIGGRPSW
ncbi:MAG: hypothetical protein U0791_09980 [Gemmataceae bacterium]